MSAEFFPTTVFHCEPCPWGEAEALAGDEVHQEHEARLVQLHAYHQAIHHPTQRQVIRDEVGRIRSSIRQHELAMRCAQTILENNCPFFLPEVTKNGSSVEITHRNEDKRRHFSLIK